LEESHNHGEQSELDNVRVSRDLDGTITLELGILRERIIDLTPSRDAAPSAISERIV
jgi:hypothetical protein